MGVGGTVSGSGVGVGGGVGVAVGNGICFGTGPPADDVGATTVAGVSVEVEVVGVSGSAVTVAGSVGPAPVQASARTSAARPTAAMPLTASVQS